ncbi:DUF4398 domain-containing protein [Breznakiella homolactica]|uniref:DUF4398 domain-containing protein n=1 Tax=Breznakiella homolactica TaxID=2798577 RepID=A0A7T7XQS3_9SPIR|nr:DUF4398 domain-containing protein [Breznakiella homolactica]QQO10763.1 DUF4398 domain-containing protein [Breznakiella homolactica]
MKNHKHIAYIVLSLIIAAAIMGCAKPPTQEMEAAQAAVTRAENDPDAVAYAEATVRRARSSLERMQQEASAKRYDSAKTYAQEATAAAEKAIADGKAAAVRGRDDATRLITEAKRAADEASNALNSARAAQNRRINFETLGEQINNARNLTEQAEMDLARNAVADATTKAENARSILAGTMTAISDGIRAASRKQ